MVLSKVKIKLPVSLSGKDHLLFTFYHVKCNMQKHSKTLKATGKANPLEDPGTGHTHTHAPTHAPTHTYSHMVHVTQYISIFLIRIDTHNTHI